MRKALFLLLGLAVMAMGAQAAQAGLDEAKIALHLQAHQAKNQCSTYAPDTTLACDGVTKTSNLVVTGSTGVSYDMYLVVVDVPPAEGLRAIEFGIEYDGTPLSGLDPYGSVMCSDLLFANSNWPNGDATAAATYTWSTCQNTVDPSDPQGECAIVCGSIYCYAYNPDTACIVVKPSGYYDATDCGLNTVDLLPNFPANRGCAGFGQPGTDPCLGGVPVKESTWGQLKRQFIDD